MQIRLFEKGNEPPPSAQGVVDDIVSEEVPLVGDVIQMEGKNGEVVQRYRVVSRLFRAHFSMSAAQVALEVEAID
jgi:hypothetical protein